MTDQRYYTGEEIHIGDRVVFCGSESSIVFVLDRAEFPPTMSPEARAWFYSENESGFMIHQDAGADIFLYQADEDLFFVSRSVS